MEESHFTISKWNKWGKIRRKLDENSTLNGENDPNHSMLPPQSVSTRITAHTGENELAELPDQQLQAQPLAGGSFFHSASDVKISGPGVTKFISDSSQNHNTSVTIVFNPSCEVTGLGQVTQSNPASPKTLQQSQIKGGDGEPMQSPTYQIPLRAPSLPVQRSSAIYFRHLASKGLGSPLWIPEPSINLPLAYQLNGISIGDVGFLTDRGSFSFLFNICTPASDPINPNDMPEWFHPLSKPDPMDVDEHSEFKSNSYLASSLVETLHEDTAAAGLIFESSASEGAILTMPKGSRSKDLVNVVNFRKYAYDNAENWYKYANKTRGRGVKNGELRLVLGLNSSSAWGMATFANHSTSSASTSTGTSTSTSPTEPDKRNGFRLKFKPIKEGTNLVGGQAYAWECGSGMAEVKSGPDIGEVERLRSAHAAESKCDQGVNEGTTNMSAVSAAGFENQCLFIRTLNVTLQDDIWKKLSDKWGSLYIGDDFFSPVKPPSLLSDSHNRDAHSSSSNGNSGLGSTEHSRGNSDQGQDHNSSYSISQWADTSTSQPSARRLTPAINTIHLSGPPAFPAIHDLHPSKTINEFLLRERPTMKMAITEDQDWISVLDMNEHVLPTPEVMRGRVIAAFEVCEEEGAVFLQCKDVSSDTGPKTETEYQHKMPAAAGLKMLKLPYHPLDDDGFNLLLLENSSEEAGGEPAVSTISTAANRSRHCLEEEEFSIRSESFSLVEESSVILEEHRSTKTLSVAEGLDLRGKVSLPDIRAEGQAGPNRSRSRKWARYRKKLLRFIGI